MKATVLVDNIARDNLKGQWGLSFFIEYEGKRFLLDTGSGSLFSENAKKKGVDLKSADYGILSHAHYDHANGMAQFFRENSKANFFLRDTCKENCFGRRFIFFKYIGTKKGTAKKYADRIEYVSGDKEITRGVYLIPHKTEGLSAIGKKAGLLKFEKGKMVPDDFDHEQSLVFETEKGLVIFNSCSHGGADNIINEIKSTFPDKKIYALIGGFHLYKSSDEEVLSLAERIEETGIEKIITGHCTGDKAFRILKDKLGDKAEQLYAGMVIEF